MYIPVCHWPNCVRIVYGRVWCMICSHSLGDCSLQSKHHVQHVQSYISTSVVDKSAQQRHYFVVFVASKWGQLFTISIQQIALTWSGDVDERTDYITRSYIARSFPRQECGGILNGWSGCTLPIWVASDVFLQENERLSLSFVSCGEVAFLEKLSLLGLEESDCP